MMQLNEGSFFVFDIYFDQYFISYSHDNKQYKCNVSEHFLYLL
jgi:hypothetical protein